MALDSRDSFASIVSFFFCRIGVFNALRVHYAEACFLFPTIAGTNLSDHFFLMPDRVCSLSLLPLRSRFQSTQSLQVRRAETLFILHFQWITALEERSWNLPGISPLKP